MRNVPKILKGGLHMKKIAPLLWIFLLFPSITWAQEKVEAPVWNVGDKWVFTTGAIEVINADQKSYTLKFSDNICISESQGLSVIIIDKSTLNRIYALEGNKRKRYTRGRAKILDFPIFTGKKWESAYSATALYGVASHLRETCDNNESFKILGWEDMAVPAGKFKTAKMEYIQETIRCTYAPALDVKRKTIYWYSPDAKYFVKAKYDFGSEEVKDWELISFKPKK
jgi:hypothetical protein